MSIEADPFCASNVRSFPPMHQKALLFVTFHRPLLAALLTAVAGLRSYPARETPLGRSAEAERGDRADDGCGQGPAAGGAANRLEPDARPYSRRSTRSSEFAAATGVAVTLRSQAAAAPSRDHLVLSRLYPHRLVSRRLDLLGPVARRAPGKSSPDRGNPRRLLRARAPRQVARVRRDLESSPLGGGD